MSDTTKSFGDKDTRKDEMSDAIENWVKELAKKVEKTSESEEFKEYLDVMSKFHDYSRQNQALILFQKPEATRVAGFNTWKNDFNRTVKEGEEAIWIWAPIITKKCPKCDNAESYHNMIDCEYDDEKPEDWDRGVVGFRPVPVFDVSQTEGEELPDIDTSAYGESEELYNALIESSDSLGVPSVEIQKEEEWKHGSAKGISKKSNGAVQVLKQENKADQTRVLIHEYAHTLLHSGITEVEEKDKREVEAESVAYVVGRHFGLDVENSSFYLASWSGEEPEAIEERIERVSKTSQEIIKTVEDKMES